MYIFNNIYIIHSIVCLINGLKINKFQMNMKNCLLKFILVYSFLLSSNAFLITVKSSMRWFFFLPNSQYNVESKIEIHDEIIHEYKF